MFFNFTFLSNTYSSTSFRNLDWTLLKIESAIFVPFLTIFLIRKNDWGNLVINFKWLEHKSTIAKLCVSKSLIHAVSVQKSKFLKHTVYVQKLLRIDRCDTIYFLQIEIKWVEQNGGKARTHVFEQKFIIINCVFDANIHNQGSIL